MHAIAVSADDLRRDSTGRRRPSIVPLLLAAGFLLALGCATASAGVLQRVEVGFTPPGGTEGVISDAIFRMSSAAVDEDIVAQSTVPGSHALSASAGRFGQVGMSVNDVNALTGSVMRAEVLVGSDEFVNIASRPARVRTSFIIDGGELRDLFSINTSVTFELQVGAQNLGIAPAGTSASPLGLEITADFGANGLFPGGGYTARLESDAGGARSFTSSFTNGLDLEATFDGVRTVEIPLSLQTLELGILGPNERLLVAYRATITVVQNGIVEGVSGQFSDPFTLSGEPNPILALNGVTLTPVPEPSHALLLLAGLALLAAARGRITAAS